MTALSWRYDELVDEGRSQLSDVDEDDRDQLSAVRTQVLLRWQSFFSSAKTVVDTCARVNQDDNEELHDVGSFRPANRRR